MDREAWRAAVHRVAKSQTRLRDRTELMVHILPLYVAPPKIYLFLALPSPGSL